MRPSSTPTCFTRVILDGIEDVEIAERHALEQRIRECLPDLPESQRLYIGNALINLAIARMIASDPARRSHT